MSGRSVGGRKDPSATTVPGDQVTTKEIVVGVGGSPAAASALASAAEQSLATGVRLRIVHAWQMTASPLEASPSFWVASAADARARATRWVMDALGGRAASVRWILEMVEVPPASVFSPQPEGSA
jgi:hypothetical protein